MPKNTATSSKPKPDAAKKSKASAKSRANTDSSIAKVSKVQPQLSPGALAAEPLGAGKPKLTLRKKTPQLPLQQMMKQAKEAKKAAAAGIIKLKEEEAKARQEEEEEAKKTAELYDPTAEEVSRAELEKLRIVVMDQQTHMEEVEKTSLIQVKEQRQHIRQLTDALSLLTEDYTKLMDAYRILSRTFDLKKEPLKDESMRGRCYFCLSPKHAGMLCYQFPSAVERRQELIREDRCFLCFESHIGQDCPYPKIKRCKCQVLPPHKEELCFEKASAEEVIKKRAQYREMKEKEQGGPSA